jgi:hypothetical protein
MRYASVAEMKEGLCAFTRPGKPYTLIQPITEQDLDHLEWKELATRRLSDAWEGEEDALYDYL